MYCTTLQNGKVKVGKAEREPNMFNNAKTTLVDCVSSLPPGHKYVAVSILTGDILYFVVDIDSKGIHLLHQVYKTLKISKTELFGLAIVSDGVFQFIDPDLKLSKYATKSWKIPNNNGIDEKGNILTFHFRVEIYVDCHLLINDKVSRHHYYLQLRENVLNYNQGLSEERAFLLTAYALQADFGNYNQNLHIRRYFEPYKYFPHSIISRVGEAFIVQHAPAMHKDYMNLTCGEAEISYIKEASDQISPHNLHFYKMSKKKSKLQFTIWLGISPTGIQLYKEDFQKLKTHMSSFLWADIAKLFFDKRKFEIRTYGYPEERKFTYYTNSETEAKNLFRLSKSNHQYYLATRNQVQTLKKLESAGRKPYRESYIYSDETDLDRESVINNTSQVKQTKITSEKISKLNQNKDNNVTSNSNNGIPSVKLDAYESLIQTDSGHSSFAENRSSSASPDMASPSWNEKLQQKIYVTELTNNNINLSPVCYPLNQVISSNINNSNCKESQNHQSPNSLTEQNSKSIKNVSYLKASQITDCLSCNSSSGISECNDKIISVNTDSSEQLKNISYPHPVLNTSLALCGRTRIGVSSLCHQQNRSFFSRLNDKTHSEDIETKHYARFQHDLSSDSGVSSPTNGTLNRKTRQCSVCFNHVDGDRTLHDICSDHLFNFNTPPIVSNDTSEEEFPCIPPPPGYGNSPEISEDNQEDEQNNEKLSTDPQQSCSAELNQTAQIIDLQQLRKKSQDMGLPLLSALCNDRSLLMLPKTVPTCSRNRHLGIDSNRRRFSCSAVNPSFIEENRSETRGRSHTTPQIRPTSWHIDRDFPWQNTRFIELQTNVVDGSIHQINSPHTSSILTSFSSSGRDSSQCVYAHPITPSRQLIPTKLSSAFGSVSTNT